MWWSMATAPVLLVSVHSSSSDRGAPEANSMLEGEESVWDPSEGDSKDLACLHSHGLGRSVT